MASTNRSAADGLFLAERYLPDASLEELQDAASVARRRPIDGSPAVRQREAIWIPGDETLISTFEASSTEELEQVLLEAGSPADRVVPAIRVGGHAMSIRHSKE